MLSNVRSELLLTQSWTISTCPVTKQPGKEINTSLPVSSQQTCYWSIQLQCLDHWYKYLTGLALELSLEEQHWDGSPVRCSPIWYNPLSSALQTVLHWAHHEPALPIVGQLVLKDVVRNSIKSLAKIQNYICHLPFIHKVRDLILEGYKIKQDHFMITAAKTANYCHVPHESFCIHEQQVFSSQLTEYLWQEVTCYRLQEFPRLPHHSGMVLHINYINI